MSGFWHRDPDGGPLGLGSGPRGGGGAGSRGPARQQRGNHQLDVLPGGHTTGAGRVRVGPVNMAVLMKLYNTISTTILHKCECTHYSLI